MGMTRRLGAALASGKPKIHRQPAANQRHRRRLCLNVKSAANGPAIGRARGGGLSRDQSAGNCRHHHRRLDLECARARAGRPCDRELEGFHCGPAKLARTKPTARLLYPGLPRRRCRCRRLQEPHRRQRERRAAGRPAAGRKQHQFRAPGRQRAWHHRSKRIGQIEPGEDPGRRLAAGARPNLSRRRDLRPMVKPRHSANISAICRKMSSC